MNDELVFFGEFEVAMDEKGRIMIPSKWKSFVNTEMMMCSGCEGAIELWNKGNFIQTYKKIVENQPPSVWKRIIQRKMLGRARDINLDKWHRFIIPAIFKRNFQDEVLLVGNGRFIEIWNKKNYEEWTNQEENTIEKATQEIYTRNISGSKQGNLEE